MKLVSFTIQNFRGYREATRISFEELTALVGKNDVGKSSILEALDIFFNDGKGLTKLETDDINKQNQQSNNLEVVFSACFSDLPDSTVIDTTNPTDLAAEHMLNENGELEVVKRYPNAGKAKIYLRALHPSNPACCDLLGKKDTDLQRIIESESIECRDKGKKACMRSSIWEHYCGDLKLEIKDIDIAKGDTQDIYSRLQRYLPVFSLFQADRKNKDTDDEIQDPLKEAVKQILGQPEIQKKLEAIADEVNTQLADVAARTMRKINEMDPSIAESLKPVIPETSSLKWSDVFKNVTISNNDGIPMGKRGSGIRRIILLNFFRAEAERRIEGDSATSIIYAIEEPETSQHASNQVLLIAALKGLAKKNKTQVIISTHSSKVVKELDIGSIQILTDSNGRKLVARAESKCLPYISSNEINYLVFGDINEEYHDELYARLMEMRCLDNFKIGKMTRVYVYPTVCHRKPEQSCLTQYIRDQIHHPENSENARFTKEDLATSIELMREYITKNV